MTFIEALYGSQYQELSQNGKDAAKGRLNGNIFLTAFLLLLIFALIILLVNIVPPFGEMLNRGQENIFGRLSGRTTGKLLAIPLFALIYFTISKTVGTEKNYNLITARFSQLPDDEKKKANKKILVPFFIILLAVLITAFLSIT